jgi:hypothetical protein
MKNLFIIATILLSTVMAARTSSAQTQSVTFNIALNEGNIKEVIRQTWSKSIKPQVESALRTELEKYFRNSSIDINIPEPSINVGADSVTFFIDNFFFDGTYSIKYLPDPDCNFHVDLTVTAKFAMNNSKQFVLSSVTAGVSDVDIDVDGLSGSVIGWFMDKIGVENFIESHYGNVMIAPGLNGLVLSNTVFTAMYPGTSTGITASMGQITYASPYLNIPVTATFTISSGGSQILSKNNATNDQLPKDFSLGQNYPNPFNPSTSIEFALPQPSNVVLKIYNTLGQEVVTLVNNQMDAGFHSVTWNGKDNTNSQVSSGLYIYRLQAGNAVFSKKMTFLK